MRTAALQVDEHMMLPRFRCGWMASLCVGLMVILPVSVNASAKTRIVTAKVNDAGQSSDLAYLEEAIKDALERSGNAEVISPDAKNWAETSMGRIDGAIDFGRSAGADKVVMLSLESSKQHQKLLLRVVDVSTQAAGPLTSMNVVNAEEDALMVASAATDRILSKEQMVAQKNKKVPKALIYGLIGVLVAGAGIGVALGLGGGGGNDDSTVSISGPRPSPTQ